MSDEPVRERIRADLGPTLFVEAGAGTGKTAALVDRVRSLVVEGGESLARIAVITFTEKAAAELRDRLRDTFADVVADPDSSEVARGAAAAALHDLDAAPVATLHAFAQRLLSEHPIEAGLPPAVEVLDEISSEITFAERWDRFVEATLVDPSRHRLVRLADVLGADLARLRDVAVAFGANWDLVDRLVDPTPPPPPAPDVGRVVAAVGRAVDMGSFCLDPDDKLLAKLTRLAEHRRDLVEAGDDEVAAVVALADIAGLKVGSSGRAPAWDGHKPDVLDAAREAVDAAAGVLDRLAQACIRCLGALVRDFTLAEAERRRREGRLEFHDLLVTARRLLTDPDHGPAVRRAARRRYTRILVDEFQDTDPLQIDLAVALAADPDADDDDASRGWRERSPGDGTLFFVGDPKQSIYRFRRADIRLFLEASDAFGPPLRLVTNWRSAAPVIDWVNHVFGDLIVAEEGAQPTYVPLEVGLSDAPRAPGVAVLGAREHPDGLRAGDLRNAEAADVAAAVTTAVAEGWPVRDLDTAEERPCRLGDVCILLPARTSLPALERALDLAGIPYRAESSSLVYTTREVRDLIGVLRAIDDPTDELAVVAALRSAAFGCGDDDLWTWFDAGGRWDGRPPPRGAVHDAHPVAAAFDWLAEVRAEKAWRTPSELVEKVVRDRGLFELGALRGRVRDQWRRLRFVTDQARAFTDATGGDLRAFIRWVELQGSGSGRVTEAVLPETDDDAVSIMTVHASKGLEFPVTVVSGLTTRVQTRRGGVRVLWNDGDGGPGVSYRFHPGLATTEFDDGLELDEQLDFHEKVRLLYVACTRARDHLVVSLHRCAPAEGRPLPTRTAMTAAQLLVDAGALAVADELETVADAPRPPPTGSTVALVDRDRWEAELGEVRARLAQRRSLAATAVAAEMHDPADVSAAAVEAIEAGLAKRPRDLDLPPWNKGRYGTAIGRAVHAVLQTVDLATGEGLADIAAAQAAAEGVVGREQVIEALARSALRSEVVTAASSAPHWRELYVATRLGDRILEGYVDLLYRTPAGLVVVDHKTDQLPDARALAAAVDRYGLQAAAYSLAVEEATGERVAAGVLLFLAEDGAVAHTVDDLRDRIDRIRAAVPGLVGGTDVVVE